MNNNATENWVPQQQSNQATASAPGDASPWVKVDDQGGSTAYDNFKNTESATEAVDATSTSEKVGGPTSEDQASEAPLKANKGQSDTGPEASAKGSGAKSKAPASPVKPHTTVLDPQRPPENWLNATLHSAEGATWNNFVRPFDKNPQDMDEYLRDLQTKHPIASIIGGTAPFIVTAPFVPESLVPNIYLRTAAQFGLVGVGAGLNRAKDDPRKQALDQVQDVSKETLKSMSFGPIFAKAQALKVLDRPFATALARAGVIAGGSGVLNKVYGDNITEAFKQGGLYGALSLITETPHLAMTTIGRGVIAHMNDIRAKSAVKAGWPVIDPHSPDVATQVHDATAAMAKQVPGVDKPHIVSATVKLNDGTQLHGTSHEDALEKINETKSTMKENTDFTAGFTVVNPDGSSKFVTREEAKQDPYNLKNGESEDVKGLNESKFMAKKDPIKIVNPETLKEIEGKVDIGMLPGVPETAEILQRSHAELREKFTPYEVGQEGKYTSEVLRENLGVMARNYDKLEASLSQAKKLFDKADKDSSLDFIYNMEEGKVQPNADLEKIAVMLRNLLDTKRDEVRALGTGKLEHFIENYFPHVWEDANGAGKIIGQIMGKRPLEGPKSFLKKRSIPSTREGIESGLTPVSYNPIDSVMLKVREMDRYLMAHRTIKSLKTEGLVKYIPIGKQSPDGWVKINDNMSTIYKSPMIAIKEAYDEHVMDNLNSVAKGLGIDIDRLMKFRGGSKMEGVLGYSRRGPEGAPGTHEDPLLNTTGDKARPGEIRTKFATPESVLAHEIGHQIDEMFNLKDLFLKDKRLTSQLRELADLRFEGKDPSQGFRQYVRKGSEKMAVMLEAYIHAPDKFKEVAPDVYKAFEDVLGRDERLKPLLGIKPSLVLGTKDAEIYAGGIVIAGHLYAQPDSARILNNYLSPGLAGKSYIYDMYRGAGNTLNQFQLGLSAFHLGFTSMDATISKFALGINKLSTGDFAGAIKEFGKAPFAPITNILQGRELLQSWYGKDKGPMTNMIADLMASAGGRAKMDKFYATGFKDSMMKSIKEGKIATAVLKVPFYIVEQVARPIMEYIVPRQKLGVFMDLMKMELERNPGLSHQEMRGVAQRAWNSVDNRMGQLVYDNLFWNKVTKDLAMASVRSLGWNLGTIREIGGGAKDVIGNVNDVIHGRGTKMSYRTAYVMALPIVTGLYGAIYQYLHTGQGPQELKDYFFPKNGGVDNKGQAARISLPTYMKDIYHYTTNPVQTVINKFSPVNNTVMEMLANKDFYGVQIRNVDDPVLQQIASESSFMASQFLPFGFRNQGRDTRTSAGSKIEPFIGITPAPFDINMTAAEREAWELEKGKIPVGSRTKEQAQHSQAKAKLRSDFMATKDKAPLDQAVKDGVISSKESKQLIKESKMTNLQRMTQHLTFEEVVHIMKKATPDEREELQKIIEKKKSGKKTRGTWTSAEEDLYAKSFDSKE